MHSTPGRGGDLDLLLIGAWSARKGQHAPAHRHAGWKIAYYRTGRITSIVDGEPSEVGAGTVQVFRPAVAHAEIAHTAYSNYYLVLNAPDDRAWPSLCHGEPAVEIGRHLAALLRESTVPDARTPVVIDALLCLVDSILQRAVPVIRRSPAEATVRTAELYLEEHYADPVSMAGVAEHLGVSPSTLRQQFASVLGRSPSMVLRSIRLRHALELLRTSDLPLAAVATRCGLYSASHLTREVKNAVGCPPGVWRATRPPRQSRRAP
jgi:AraC-like DNA-binding protein